MYCNEVLADVYFTVGKEDDRQVGIRRSLLFAFSDSDVLRCVLMVETTN